MLNKLKPKSEFSRNVVTLMTGTTIAQAIPIAISPILTRMYSPDDFGVFAFFIAIVAILSSIINARYELAIMLPKKDEDAINIFALAFIINFTITFILLILVVFFHDFIIKIIDNKSISLWLYFIPFVVFIIGFFNILIYFNNRKNQYKNIAKATITKSIVLVIIQLSFGFYKQGVSGLITGQILSQISANLKLFISVKELNLFKFIKVTKIIVLAKKYNKFPKYSMFHVLFNNISSNIPVLLLTSYYSAKTAGFYSLVNQIIGIPSGILSKSMSDVFFRECNIAKNNNKEILCSLYKNLLTKLIVILLPIFIIIFFVGPKVVGIVFGDRWIEVGIYLQILLPMFFLGSIGSVMSNIINIFQKQKKGLILEVIGFVLKLISLIIGIWYNDIYIGLILFSISGSVITLYRLKWYYSILREYSNGV